ncbi:MAG TPA: four-carbon acid sugar kinase family protein [Anaerolineales bacterium]
MSRIELSKTLASLPVEWPSDPVPDIQAHLRASKEKLVVIDDDPTGSQTVHDTPILTGWDLDSLRDELRNELPAFYILTNTRGMSLDKAKAINAEIGRNLHDLSQETSTRIAIVSRSDSTLRGHFPGEVAALVEGWQADLDAWLIIPTLLGGGRYTIGDIHYVADGDWLVPVGESPYAKDATFGFHSSDLKDWVEEKTDGAVTSAQVQSISLKEIRGGGPAAVEKHLLELPKGSICVVNAVSLRDLEVFTLGVLAAERQERRFIYRTGPSFVPVRIGLRPYPLLDQSDLPPMDTNAGGLIVVGSYVPNTSRQIQILQQQDLVCSIEVDVENLLVAERRESEIELASQRVNQELARGNDTLLFTSRTLVSGQDGEKSLEIGQIVSSGVISILKRVSVRPRYVLAKGGITSSDVATEWLGVKRAMVLGQISRGISVWQLGPESRYDGLIYIVFPGNVGNPESLAEVVSMVQAR